MGSPPSKKAKLSDAYVDAQRSPGMHPGDDNGGHVSPARDSFIMPVGKTNGFH